MRGGGEEGEGSAAGRVFFAYITDTVAASAKIVVPGEAGTPPGVRWGWLRVTWADAAAAIGSSPVIHGEQPWLAYLTKTRLTITNKSC